MAFSPSIYQYLDNLPIAAALLSNYPNTEVLMMNAEFKRVFQLTKHDYEGFSILEFLSEGDHQSFQLFLDTAITSEQDSIWKLFNIATKDPFSNHCIIKIVANLGNRASKEYFLLLGLPIDEIDLENFSAKQKIEESKSEFQTNKYHGIIENANVGIAIFNIHGYLEETNLSFADHIGRQRENFINQHFCSLFGGDLKRELGRLFRKIDEENQALIKDVFRFNLDDHKIKILELDKIISKIDKKLF